MRIRADLAILSDLDGTLIDSTASTVAAYLWWAELRGLSPSVLDRIPFGRTSADAAADLAPQLNAEVEGRLLDDRQAEDTVGVVALPGAADLLGSHERLAVVTSGSRPLAEARLRAAGLPLPAVLITPELWTRGKPDPEPFLLGAAELGAKPSGCVVLEDAPAGVQAGIAAGMPVIALLTTHRKDELPEANRWIESIEQLPTALREMGLS
jgi:sugar-phosphatase